MNILNIDLETYRTKGSKVFTGRERGKKIREESKIDDLVNTNDLVYINIPSGIMSVNPSFLEEFLFNIVIKLGKEKFYSKVQFITESKRYNIADDLEEAVDRILRSNNALSK
jgi:hypothetical protein